MKICNGLIVGALLLGSNCFGQTPANRPTQATPKFDPGYTIIVAPPAEPFRLRSPMKINIQVAVGEKEIYWRAVKGDTAYRAFKFSLMKDGHEIETSLFHRRITNTERPSDPQGDPGGGGSIVSTAEPGKSFTFTADLMKLYEITEPGTYTLDVSRLEEDNKTIVRAKPVTFSVIL
jgi:hypothetical protein